MLAPGEVANTLRQSVRGGVSQVPRAGPDRATWRQMHPPNQTTPIYLKYSSLTCSKNVPILTVSVVQPGSGG